MKKVLIMICLLVSLLLAGCKNSGELISPMTTEEIQKMVKPTLVEELNPEIEAARLYKLWCEKNDKWYAEYEAKRIAEKEWEEHKRWFDKTEVARDAAANSAYRSSFMVQSSKFQLGMTVKQVNAICRPNDINRSVGSWGIHEQWVYDSVRTRSGKGLYLYFENGILTSWQN